MIDFFGPSLDKNFTVHVFFLLIHDIILKKRRENIVITVNVKSGMHSICLLNRITADYDFQLK